jgi:4-cresol dehydrogenase (hydroxylating)
LRSKLICGPVEVTDLQAALWAWRAALGADNVQLNDPANPREGLRTFGKTVEVPATILPASAEEVAAAVTIAARNGIGLHPVSRGRNWGLGSRAPNRDGDVVIDLSRLDRISGFDAREGIVHVEPGVSFIQLYSFLQSQDCDYFLPTIGGPVQASVLANALDRGDAVMCDRWKSISDLSVVLADGSIIETGHGKESPLAGRGIPPSGPILDGLFSQSNFGIVTGAWLRLSPMPSNISGRLINIGGRDKLEGFVAAWRELQRSGTLPDRSFILWNGIKFRARGGRRSSYAADDIERAQLDDWYCAGFVLGESAEILAARDRLVDKKIAGHAEGVQSFTARSEGQWLDDAQDIFATPRQMNLRTVYWRHTVEPDLDTANPDHDNCGLIWICLAMPFDGAAIREFAIWAKERLAAANMDLNFGLEAASFRTALAYLTMTYERGQAADEAALACYQDIVNHAVSLGFSPYRQANGLSIHPDAATASRMDALAAIRQSLDSQGTIGAGKVALRPRGAHSFSE